MGTGLAWCSCACVGLGSVDRPKLRTRHVLHVSPIVPYLCWWVWMVVRFVCVIRVPLCARLSPVSRVCPGANPSPPESFWPPLVRIHTTTIFSPLRLMPTLMCISALAAQDNTETCTRLAQAGACGCWQCRVLPSRACTAAQTVSCREAGDGCCARLVLS